MDKLEEFILNAGKATQKPESINRRIDDLSKWQPVIYWAITFVAAVCFIIAFGG